MARLFCFLALMAQPRDINLLQGKRFPVYDDYIYPSGV
jgi:hypothetical protein